VIAIVVIVAVAALVAARERGETASVVSGTDFERALRERA